MVLSDKKMSNFRLVLINHGRIRVKCVLKNYAMQMLPKEQNEHLGLHTYLLTNKLHKHSIIKLGVMLQYRSPYDHKMVFRKSIEWCLSFDSSAVLGKWKWTFPSSAAEELPLQRSLSETSLCLALVGAFHSDADWIIYTYNDLGRHPGMVSSFPLKSASCELFSPHHKLWKTWPLKIASL